MYADDIVLFAPSTKCLLRIIDVSYTYGYENDIYTIFLLKSVGVSKL